MKNTFTLIFVLASQLLVAQGAIFTDVSSSSGINNSGSNYGVAIADYDNDGHEDIYVTRQSEEPNLLYRNNGDGTFTDVATSVGLADTNDGMMSVWGDIDNDGDLDLYVGNRMGDTDVLYLNENGMFTDISSTAGISSPEQPRSINFADIDNDGFIDIYIANINAENVLYRNNGDHTFTDIVQSSGTTDDQISMGAVFFNYDNDGDQDLYLTHDGNQDFILYQNDGQGQFENVAPQADVALEKFGMGVDVADFNQDGHLDMYITNLYENSLLINDGDGTFTDISITAGIEDLGMGWGIICMDYDNDTYPDIYVCNESNVTPMRNNILYHNNGDETFTNASASNIIGSPYRGTGTACGDFNNDGMADIFVANKGTEGNQLFINQTNEDNNWIKIKTVGTMSNRDGIGARVMVEIDGKTLIDEVTAGSGFASQNSMTLQFGLGDANMVDQLRVIWPSGHEDVYTDIIPNQKVTVVENENLSIIQNIPTANVDLTFQNPSSKALSIFYETEETGDLLCSIVDLSGEVLMQKALANNVGTIEWLAPKSGLFFIKMEIGGAILTKALAVD